MARGRHSLSWWERWSPFRQYWFIPDPNPFGNALIKAGYKKVPTWRKKPDILQ